MKSWFRFLQEVIHENAVKKGFWGTPINIPEKLALVHSEVSEALEELRATKFDTKKFGEELADVVIRVLDIGEHFGIDIYMEVVKKHEKNIKRPYKHGKKF